MTDEPPPPITLNPIGAVHNVVTTPRPDGWAGVESRIEVGEAYRAGLAGLEGFSHIIVVYWLHLVPPELRTADTEPAGPGLPAVGAFATRRQTRPNPLGVSVVPLLRVTDGALVVRGLDAVDGTPVLDIKPYLPPYDSVTGARMPEWVWGRPQRS
jgi:tRNA-Thr(GGU) m(6)t(6)A37 methyltransferase TsaA